MLIILSALGLVFFLLVTGLLLVCTNIDRELANGWCPCSGESNLRLAYNYRNGN